jgi:hypothetical protein
VKPLSAGSEIDAWCTKCRLDLGHRIVAMVLTKPKRVECQTCGSQHNYRAPKTLGSAKLVQGRTSRPPSSVPRVTAKARAEADRIHDWESRVNGQPGNAFTRYSMERSYKEGELVSHRKFGDGFVVALRGGGKVEIMFRDGIRTLAQGQD